MIDTEPKADPRFTPYQAEFFRRFVAEVRRGSVHVLVAPVGTGKSFALAATLSELARTGRMVRNLVLSPAPLVPQWASRLADLGQHSVVLDGPSLRLLREEIGEGVANWREGIYVMSVELAKRIELQEFIASVPWDLVTIDEAHYLAGSRLHLIERMLSAKPAPSLLLATHIPDPRLENFAANTRVVDWTAAFAAFIASDASGPQLTHEVKTYRRSSEEVAVAHRVLEAARQLEQSKAVVLLEQAASSLRSLEDTLVGWLESDQKTGDRAALEPLLGALENTRRDSKLDCFVQLVQELVDRGIMHLVAFCEYRATMEYIAEGLEGCGTVVHQLHDEMNIEQALEVFRAFADRGGALVTTGIEGFSLNFVEAVVHFDLPISLSAFAAREGRYRRYGRQQPGTVYFLRPETGAQLEEKLLDRILEQHRPIHAQLADDVGKFVRDLLAESGTRG